MDWTSRITGFYFYLIDSSFFFLTKKINKMIVLTYAILLCFAAEHGNLVVITLNHYTVVIYNTM